MIFEVSTGGALDLASLISNLDADMRQDLNNIQQLFERNTQHLREQLQNFDLNILCLLPFSLEPIINPNPYWS